MWADEGPSDPSRMSLTELSDEEVVQKVKSITSLRAADPCNINCPITPYGMENQLPEVNNSFKCLYTHSTSVEFCFVFTPDLVDLLGPFELLLLSSTDGDWSS